MGMKNGSEFKSGKMSTCFENGSESVRRRFVRGRKHATVEKDGVEGETVLGRGFDEGIEEEGVGVGDGEEETAGVGDGTGGARESEEFGEKGATAVTTGDNEMSVSLLERSNVWASTYHCFVFCGF